MGLNPNQHNWAIVEIELLALVWALVHSRFYTIVNPDVHIIKDHSPIVGILKKSLHQIDNTRIVKLIERISHYSLTIEHVKGRDNHIADMLLQNPDKSMEALDIEHNFCQHQKNQESDDKIRSKSEERKLPVIFATDS